MTAAAGRPATRSAAHRVLGALGPAVAVCAHPDDESFGLGGVIDALSGLGVGTSVICFTRGEASTLRLGPGDLGRVREAELMAAGRVLGTRAVELFDYPDGALSAVALDDLVDKIVALVTKSGARSLLAFDDGGITGHPDHQRATDASLVAAVRLDLPVLAWAVPRVVAATLNGRFGTAFVGRSEEEVDFALEVDRSVQRRAIDCHVSQSTDNEVLRLRLALMGGVEWLRWLRPPR